MNTNRRGLAAAMAACAAALVAAPTAAANVEMKISAPKGSDVLIEELTLKAKCDEACTLGLNRVQAINFKGGQQLPVTSEEPLKGSKRLKPGRTATFNVPLAPRIRSQIQSAAKSKEATVVQVVTDYNGVEGPYRSATLRVASAPKAPVGQDDIVLAAKPKVRAGAPRFRVTVEGVQTTEWRYNRNYGEGGCVSWARGSGKETIRLKSKKPMVARYARRAGQKAEHELIAANGDLVWFRVALDVARTGERDHGGSAGCAGGGGHCPECDGPNPQTGKCTARGTRDIWLAPMLLPRGRLSAVAIGSRDLPPLTPDCPIEQFKGALGDPDLLDADNKLGDPVKRGGGKKVILFLRDKQTDKLDESGGFTTTRVRYTVTFTRV